MRRIKGADLAAQTPLFLQIEFEAAPADDLPISNDSRDRKRISDIIDGVFFMHHKI